MPQSTVPIQDKFLSSAQTVTMNSAYHSRPPSVARRRRAAGGASEQSERNEDLTAGSSSNQKRRCEGAGDGVNPAPQYRQNYIHWDHYYMGMAFLARHRSKDPAYQVGACIVNEDKKVLGVGYNGMPTGCSDETMPWIKGTPSRLDSKAFYVCHAELNAIMFRNSMDLKGCTMYVTLFPCNECAKLIIQAGIVKVIYFSDEKKEKDEFKAARKMFIGANVGIEEYRGSRETIELKFSTQNLSSG